VKTRAAVLTEMGRPRPYTRSRPLTIEEVELDAPGPGEVLVRMRAAGLCHSDLSVINGDRPRPMPMALGHEAAGVVEQLGEGDGPVGPLEAVVCLDADPRKLAAPPAERVALVREALLVGEKGFAFEQPLGSRGDLRQPEG